MSVLLVSASLEYLAIDGLMAPSFLNRASRLRTPRDKHEARGEERRVDMCLTSPVAIGATALCGNGQSLVAENRRGGRGGESLMNVGL